jgi:thioesterase domain-containing protein
VSPDHSPAVRKGDRSHVTSILLPKALSQATDVFARQQNVTLYSLAAAALALMLHRVTGDPRIVVGSQVANREEPVAEKLVGPTVNSIMLCLPVDDGDELRGFVRTVANTVREALQHERLPFEIVAGLAARRDGESLDAINLVVHRSYSGIAETEQAEPGHFSLVSLPSYSSGTPWDLNFYLIGRDEGWRMSCEADGDLYDPGTVQDLLDDWHRCLEILVTSPGGRLRDSAALREGPGRAGVQSQPTSPLAAGICEPIPVHDPARQVIRFHESGANTPAIVFNNRSVYYQLARQLGEGRPFIDILLYHQDGPLELKSRTFEDFATYALRLVRWAQPRGPYILGGHCVYGVLAFEAARQLRQMGEQVALVALFDSWAPGYRESMSRWDQALRRQQLRLHRYAERLKRFRKGEVGLNEIVRKPILFHLGLLPPEPGPVRQSLPGEWFDDYLYDAVARYRPMPYDGDVVLFRSNEPLRGRLFDEQMGWGPLVTGHLKKIDVNSGHFDMFREQPAGQIATSLQATLDEAKGR